MQVMVDLSSVTEGQRGTIEESLRQFAIVLAAALFLDAKAGPNGAIPGSRIVSGWLIGMAKQIRRQIALYPKVAS